MKWYWWIVISILALNGLVVLVIGVFMLAERVRGGGTPDEMMENSTRDEGKK